MNTPFSPARLKRFTKILVDLIKLTTDIETHFIESRLSAFSDANIFKNINSILQQHWLRPKSKERWEMVDAENILANKNHIIPLLNELNLYKAIYPTKKYYDAVLIHGASLDTFIIRVQFLCKIWNQGVRFGHVYLLTGKEPYSSGTYTSEVQTSNSGLNAIPCLTINAEDFIPLGTRSRYNTRDTLIAWKMYQEDIKANLNTKNILAISNQPYIAYQHQVTSNVLSTHKIETVGTSINEPVMISVMIDTVARWLFEYVQTHQ